MKIRTDFVTNSSSSSYVLDIVAELKDNEKVEVHLGSPAEEDGDSDVTLLCDAEKLLEAKTFDELRKLISDSFVDGYDGVDYFGEDYYDEDDTSDEFHLPNPKSELDSFLDGIEERIHGNLDELLRMTFTRTWIAWGEASSCFESNMDYMAPEFQKIAKRASKPDASEEDKLAFIRYCEDFPGRILAGWGGAFPDGLMNCKNGRARLVYKASPEETAKNVAEGNFCLRGDYAEEEVKVDFSERTTMYDGRYDLEN